VLICHTVSLCADFVRYALVGIDPTDGTCGTEVLYPNWRSTCSWPLPQVEVSPAWEGAVAAAGLAPLPWRKSSEYFTLIRSHADLAANDTVLEAVFAQRLCVDAEHEFR